MRPTDPVRTISGVIKRESTKAICMSVTAISGIDLETEEIEAKEEWFPFSQVSKIIRNPNGQDELVVSEWILKQKSML